MVEQMKKIDRQFIFLFLFIVGCNNSKVSTPAIEPVSSMECKSYIQPVHNTPPVCPIVKKVSTKDAHILYAEPNVYSPIVGLWTEQASRHFAASKSWIGNAPGNGQDDKFHKHKKRHTAVFIPGGFNYEKNPDVIIWLHGHYGFNKFGTRLFRHLHPLMSEGLNPVVIAIEQPWSAWTKTPKSRNGTGPFKNLAQFSKWLDFMFDVLHKLGIPPENVLSKNITLIGHSAGGSGVMAMAKAGILSSLRPGKIIFSDSSYGRWFDVTYDKYIVSAPYTKVFVLTQKNGKPWKSMQRFFYERKRAGHTVSSNVIHVPTRLTHKQIGDNCLLFPRSPF